MARCKPLQYAYKKLAAQCQLTCTIAGLFLELDLGEKKANWVTMSLITATITAGSNYIRPLGRGISVACADAEALRARGNTLQQEKAVSPKKSA